MIGTPIFEPSLRIDVVTLFPDLVASLTSCGVTGRALERGLFQLKLWNPRDFANDRHRTVDDRPYGGGPGMLMKVEPLRRAIQAARAAGGGKVIYLSPQGRRLDQGAIRQFASGGNIVLLAGRYEGIDERLIELEVDEEWSIGDYVLSGGELAAMVIIDAVARLLPGALGDAQSAVQDSFMEGILDCPHYTRPEKVDGLTVPSILREGNHAEIARWRRKQALGRTWERRPDLLDNIELKRDDRRLLEEYQAERGIGVTTRNQE